MENGLINRDINEALSSAFLEYAGYNLQRRAIPDARDGLKWGARQLLHAQTLGKFTYDKPFKKAIKSVAQAMGFSYVHGDASAYGTFIRMAKPFAMNIPLQEARGNYGTLINPDDHSASRYVELRGSEAAAYLLKDLEKDVITEWEDTYDLEGKFPKVLPAKGFWNLVNGCISIGSGMSCSIPPTNLKEVNEKLIQLLWNENISDDELIVMPDFPTGATILNENQVKESMKEGHGFACKIRATIDFDSNERCLIVKEMPYSTYTNTICKELAVLMEENSDCGISSFSDYTKQKPDLRIYLTKKSNVDKVLKLLYKNTSLQTFFSINMVALDKGIVPRPFTWKELLQAHINHEKEVYTRSFEYDLDKIDQRLHIIEGILIALARIEEVIETIKSSTSTQNANKNLCEKFVLTEIQAKAILDMKLSRLAKLEAKKFEDEKEELLKEHQRIITILNDEILFKKEIEKGLLEVSKKFGDARRTQVLNVENEDDEPTEVRNLSISLTNQGNIFVSENSSLMIQRRGGVGNKFKLNDGEFVISTSIAETTDIVLFFTTKGYSYHYLASGLPIDSKVPIESLFEIKTYDKVCAMSACNKRDSKQNVIFFTKEGMMKKSLFADYSNTRGNGIKSIELTPNDEIISVIFTNEEKVGMLTAAGQFIICETKDIRPIGRVAKGVKGIKLNDGDELVSAKAIPSNTKQYISVTGDGCIKRTESSEISVTGRYTKGSKLQKLKTDTDFLIDFEPINDEKEIIIVSTRAHIKIKVDEIPLLGKNAQGNKSIKMTAKDSVIGISKF